MKNYTKKKKRLLQWKLFGTQLPSIIILMILSIYQLKETFPTFHKVLELIIKEHKRKGLPVSTPDVRFGVNFILTVFIFTGTMNLTIYIRNLF